MSSVARRIDDPLFSAVHIGKGERIIELLAESLNLVNSESFHKYRSPANLDVELHYHDYDEYWLFTVGNPNVTLCIPTGITKFISGSVSPQRVDRRYRYL